MHKILIVDNSVDLLEMMKSLLERRGYTVKILPEASNIYREITDFQPDVLILDVYLDGLDGREICRQIKKGIDNINVRIVIFSASPAALENYKGYFADGFIEKPFDIENLVEKITSVLNVQTGPGISA